MAIDFVTPADVETWETAWRENTTSLIGRPNETPLDCASRVIRNVSWAKLAYGPDMLGRVLMHWDGYRVLIRHSYRSGQHVCEYVRCGAVGSRPTHPPSGDGYRPLAMFYGPCPACGSEEPRELGESCRQCLVNNLDIRVVPLDEQHPPAVKTLVDILGVLREIRDLLKRQT